MLEFLPQDIIDKLKPYINNGLQEIRLRVYKPCFINVNSKTIKLNSVNIYPSTIEKIILNLTKHSLYAYENSIAQGYLTGENGERVGIVGECVYDNGLRFIKNITSLCIRIPCQIKGCSEKIANEIFSNSYENLLIISKPGAGKTTYLRDFCRIISTKLGRNVLLVDEKNEISGKDFEIGERTDVFLLSKKSFGLKQGVLNMRPDYIILDELSRIEDIEALIEACYSGVNVIASAHGTCIEDLKYKPMFEKIFENKVFKYALILSDRNGVGTVERLEQLY